VGNTLVTTFKQTFFGCSSLTAIPSGLFDKQTAVTEFASTFYGCSSLTSIPANLFDNCTAVTTFATTFYNCTGITSGDIGTWDWVGVTTASNLFFGNTVTINTTDYNSSLVGIEGQAVNDSVAFHGGSGSVATGAGLTARTALINDHSWTITDGTP